MGFFEVVLEVLNLEVLVLEVLLVVDAREDVGDEISILVALEEVRQGILAPFPPFGLVVFLPIVTLVIIVFVVRATTPITIAMINAPSLVGLPIVIIILAFMMPIPRPMRVIRRVFIIAARPVIFVILLVLPTIVPPTALLDVSVGGYIRQDLREDVALSAVPAKTVVRDQMVTENNG